MAKYALYVPLEAKPGKEKDVSDFLRSALPLVNAEPGTISWFAIQEGPSRFAIFDTFDDEARTRRSPERQGRGSFDGEGEGGRIVCQSARDLQNRILADKK